MISKSAPLPQMQPVAPDLAAASQALPQRLSLRNAMLLIAGVSALLWVAIGMIADRLFG